MQGVGGLLREAPNSFMGGSINGSGENYSSCYSTGSQEGHIWYRVNDCDEIQLY